MIRAKKILEKTDYVTLSSPPPLKSYHTHTYKYYTSCCNAVKSYKGIKTGCSTSQCSRETIWHKATTPIYTCHILVGWKIPVNNKNTAEKHTIFLLLVGQTYTSFLPTLYITAWEDIHVKTSASRGTGPGQPLNRWQLVGQK